MEPDLASEWLEIQAAVKNKLRESAFIAQQQGSRVLQFLVLPAWGDRHAVDVLSIPKRDHANHCVVWKTSWIATKDIEAFLSPVARVQYKRPFEPTISTRQLEIPQEEMHETISDLNHICLKIVPERPKWGVDGISFELSIGGSHSNCRFKWWGKLPEEWKDLQHSVQRICQWLPKE